MKEYSKVLQNELKGSFLLNEPLKNHTTFRIGGKTPLLFIPEDLESAKKALLLLHQEKIPYRILGNGSNLLVRDEDMEEVVFALKEPFFDPIISSYRMRASAGTSLHAMSQLAFEEGLSGMEFLTGIPGALGGGLIMNAGLKREWLGSLVVEVVVLDEKREIQVLREEDLLFGYRESSLRSSPFIILEALLELKPGSQEEIGEAMRSIREVRKRRHPRFPCAGSVFKNPPGDYAGRLIEACGLKGKRVGDAMIAEKHANFIVNRGNGKAQDVLDLIQLIQEKVNSIFSIYLDLEIEIW